MPGQKFLNVSGPGFVGERSGDFRSVTTLQREEGAPDDILFCSGYGAAGYVTKAAPGVKGFKRSSFGSFFGPLGQKIVYGFDGRQEQWYPSAVQYNFYEGYGAPTTRAMTRLVGQVTVRLRKRKSKLQQSYLVQYDSGQRGLPWPDTLGEVPFFRWRGVPLGKKEGSIGLAVLHNELVDEQTGFITLLSAPHLTSIRYKKEGVEVVETKIPVPDHPLGHSASVCSALETYSPGCLVGLFIRYPYEITKESDGEIDWEFERYPDRKDILFKNSGPVFWVGKSEDFGKSWSFIELENIDEPTPALYPPFSANPPVLNEQPLIGMPLWGRQEVNLGGGLFGRFFTRAPFTTGTAGSEIQYACHTAYMTSEICVVGPSTFLLFFCIRDSRDYGDAANSTGIMYRSLLFRTADGGTTWASIKTPLTSLPSEAPPLEEREDALDVRMTNVGEGNIIMRVARGLSNTVARELLFLRSSNHGITWEKFSPAGLPSQNSQELGYVTAIPGRGETPRLIVSAWDGESYRLYSSDDRGHNWKPRGRIDASAFLPMDSGRGDGGGTVDNNFGVVNYVPYDLTSPIDPVLPWRLDDSFQPLA